MMSNGQNESSGVATAQWYLIPVSGRSIGTDHYFPPASGEIVELTRRALRDDFLAAFGHDGFLIEAESVEGNARKARLFAKECPFSAVECAFGALVIPL
jgi:homoserine acetyltransferase